MTGSPVGTAIWATKTMRTKQDSPTTRLLVIPAPYILTLAFLGLFSSSASSGSTKKPMGMTAMRAPIPFTLMFSILQRMPWPNSWMAMVSTNANQTANVDGTYSFTPGISRMFCGLYIPVGSGWRRRVNLTERRSSSAIRTETMTTATTPADAYIRRGPEKRLKKSRNEVFVVFIAIMGP